MLLDAFSQHHIGLAETDEGVWAIKLGPVLLLGLDEREHRPRLTLRRMPSILRMTLLPIIPVGHTYGYFPRDARVLGDAGTITPSRYRARRCSGMVPITEAGTDVAKRSNSALNCTWSRCPSLRSASSSPRAIPKS